MADQEVVVVRIAESLEKGSAVILIISLLATALLAAALLPMPPFNTDLSSFAPETQADEAQVRIESEIGTSPHMMYVNVKPSSSNDGDFLPNVLEMGAIHRLSEDHALVESYSEMNGGVVASQLNAVEILQRTIEERGYQGEVSDFENCEVTVTK